MYQCVCEFTLVCSLYLITVPPQNIDGAGGCHSTPASVHSVCGFVVCEHVVAGRGAVKQKRRRPRRQAGNPQEGPGGQQTRGSPSSSPPALLSDIAIDLSSR